MAEDVSHAADGPASAPRRRRRRWWLRMWIYLFIAVLGWALLVWFVQRSVVFPRYLITVPAQAQVPERGERWSLDTEAGTVEAWFLPGEGVSPDAPGPAVVFAHGNGETIDDWPAMLAGYRAVGVSVLLPEYRGYGRSAGRPSQRAITADFLAFYDRLAARPEVDPERIVLHGRSIGNGVLATVAQQREPAAWICESSFTSLAAVARGYLVPRFLVRDPFEVREVIAQYERPVLILHGREDTLIPPRHGERLHAAASHSELILYDGIGHNDPPPLDRYWRDIQRFMREAGIVTRDNRDNEAP